MIAVFRPTRACDADAVLRCVRILRAVQAGIERRDCGTGAGGFQPGNKCAGGGDGGGADSGGGSPGGSGDSSGGSGGSVEQAKPGDGPVVKAARDEHKKALDRLRKNIEAAEAKGEAKFQKAADEYFKAKDAHYDVAERAGKLQEEYAVLGQKLGADPSNETLKSQFAEATRLMENSFSEMETAEKAMRKADAKREKARQDMRAATAIALRKEVDAVNKEDGTEPRNRARVEEMMSSPERIASQSLLTTDTANFAAVHAQSLEIAARPVVAQEIKTANEYALRVVNPEIHGQAMTTPISFEESVRAYARVKEYDHDADRIPGALGSLQTRGSVTRLAASDTASTHLHEMAHHIEFSTPEVRQLTADFLESRTRGEQQVEFSKKFPSHGYSEDERGSPDDFKKAFVAAGYSEERAEVLAHYSGKRYGTGSTEVLTMGMELMYRDARAFAAADPEWFDLVAGITTGRILTRTRRAKKSQVPFRDS